MNKQHQFISEHWKQCYETNIAPEVHLSNDSPPPPRQAKMGREVNAISRHSTHFNNSTAIVYGVGFFCYIGGCHKGQEAARWLLYIYALMLVDCEIVTLVLTNRNSYELAQGYTITYPHWY